MTEVKNKVWNFDIFLPGTSTSDLRGRQSVRATFKLTENAINAISIVSTHLGIKQKSLFDHLIEDTRTLQRIAGELHAVRMKQLNRVQKTFVISRKTLSVLEEVSKSSGTPRDALVECSIHRLLPIIVKERARHDRRIKLMDKISSHLAQGNVIFKEAAEQLGADDPLTIKLENVIHAYQAAAEQIAGFIQKGRIIESFSLQETENVESFIKGAMAFDDSDDPVEL